MALAIPKRQLETIGQLLDYDKGKLNLLVKMFRAFPPALFPSKLAEEFSAVTNTPQSEALSVVQTIITIYATRIGQQLTVDKFLAEFCKSVQDAGIKSQDQAWTNFKEFITEILNLKGAIEITSKAWDVLLGNERNFIEGKIFTDLRPVFRENPAEPPAGAVVVHTLKIEYKKDNDRKEIFISLDSSDLQKLKRVIERASIKEASLLALISEVKLPVVKPEG